MREKLETAKRTLFKSSSFSIKLILSIIHERVVTIDMSSIMTNGETNTISATQLIGCPRCSARLRFQRNSFPLIDGCGFESYSLACDQCGAQLAGIIDPVDDQLLLSEL